jgi:hypothetical protein
MKTIKEILTDDPERKSLMVGWSLMAFSAMAVVCFVIAVLS